MPLPVHNVLASTVNLAKSWLMTLDSRQVETPVPTETLKLWLNTLVELATPAQTRDLADGAKKTVMGAMVQMTEAHRTEADVQAGRGDRAY